MLRLRAVFALLPLLSLASAVAGTDDAPLQGPAGVAIDVRASSIEIDATLDPERGTIDEIVSIRVDAKGLSRLAFRLDENLVVRSVKASAGYAEFHQAGSRVTVDLDRPIDGSRGVTFRIAGVPRAKTETEIGPRRAVLAPSSAWYPELAGVWATGSVTLRIPSGWGAVASGSPDGRMAPGVARFIFKRPVRSIAAAAAPGLGIADASIVEVPFHLAHVAAGPTAKTAASRLAPAMAWLSGALAPYPFESFSLVLLPGYEGRVRGSGLLVAPAAVPMATDADGADLLAGQWFGESLAGDGAWIEAFAAWEAVVFARDRGLPVPAEIARLREEYFRLLSGDVALASAAWTAPDAVLRGKGSAAPDMVRLVAGDRATFDAVRELFRRPIGPPVSLEDVTATIAKQAGRPLDRVVTDWFKRAGAPAIEGVLRTIPASNGGYRADVTFRQTRGAYALPVEIVLYGPGEEHRETVEIDGETTSVFYVLPFEAKRLEIDPLDRIFRRK